MKQLAVVILNWNGGTMLARCLRSLEREFSLADVFVIDNHSTDDSAIQAKRDFPSVQVVNLDTNYGFAGGYNRGLPAILSGYQFVLLLNNDTMVEVGLGTGVDAMIEQLPPRVGMIAMRMVLHSSGLIDNFGLVLHPSGLAFNAKDAQMSILCPSGGAAIYRSTMLLDLQKKTGEIFDAEFGFYNEDLDLGFRARMLGWDCACYGEKAIYHAHGQSVIKRGNTFALYHLQRNQLWMLAKDYPTRWWWKYGWQIVLVQLAEVLYHSMRGNAKSIFRAKWRGLIGVSRMRQKRTWLCFASQASADLCAPTTSLLKLWRASGQ